MRRDHDFTDYRGRRVTVMGLGSFGGGVGAARFLAERGAIVTVTDLRSREQLAESLAELADVPVAKWRLEGHDEADFVDANLVVVNPAVKRDHPLLLRCQSEGVPLTSEMNLFWQHNRGRVLAVTGSNGKSTTTALLHNILLRECESSFLVPSPPSAGERIRVRGSDSIWREGESHPPQTPLGRGGEERCCWLGGNLGRSLLLHVDEIAADDWVVLELSSFQLADLDRLQVSPHVAVITNFSPNHLDWHGTFEHYRWAKQTMLRWQTEADFHVVNADDVELSTWRGTGRRLEFGLDRQPEDPLTLALSPADGGEGTRVDIARWLRLPGRHNLANALAASTAALAVGASTDAIQRGLETYEPLPHRLQFVGEAAGRRFYNDSLATTPESTMVALVAFEQPIVLLAGGYDKRVDLCEMAGEIAVRAKAVALMGQTGSRLRELITVRPARRAVVSEPLSDFNAAFDWAVAHSSPGDVVLLSPGCASYDWFRNFVDRGDQFTRLAREWMARNNDVR